MTQIDPEPAQFRQNTAPSRILDILDAILPASLRHVDIEERSRARILVGFALIFCGVSLAAITVQVLRGTPLGVAYGILVGVTHSAILIGIRAGITIPAMSQIFIGTVFTLSVGVMIGSAAEAGTAVLVASLIPLMSILVTGPRAAPGWTLATLGGVAATAVYASSTDDYRFSGAVLSWNHVRFPIIAATVLAVHAATMILERARALAVQEAHHSRDQLDKQAARYRSIVESLGDVLMDFGDKGFCEYIGPNCEEVLGRPESDFLGIGYLSLVHPDDLEDLIELYRFSAAHPGATRALPLRIRRKRDDWLHLQLCSRCYFDESGKLRFTAILRDTSSLRLAEMTTRHRDRLESAGTLSAGIAHQINNPIGSILTGSQFALISLEDNDLENVKQTLKDNIEQATRCGTIVRSLLHFSARETPTTGRENLVEIVRRSREFAISYAGETSITIEISGHLEPLWVDVNPIEIEQVLINLLCNAIESQPASKQVDVSLSTFDARARIEIQDDGCGISEADRAQIFDPFYTTRIREGGSGLGLSVAHGIVRDHGGSMDVESRTGHGTRFGVELPLASL